MTDTTLRECPFCGSEEISLRRGMVAFYDYEVWCEGCGICGPNFGAMDGSEENEDQNRAAAIEHWNRRAPSRDSKELRELSEAASSGKWLYRPQLHDDWGVIRGGEVQDAFGDDYLPICAVARGRHYDKPDWMHRRDGTDPYGPNAKFICALVNMYRKGIENG